MRQRSAHSLFCSSTLCVGLVALMVCVEAGFTLHGQMEPMIPYLQITVWGPLLGREFLIFVAFFIVLSVILMLSSQCLGVSRLD